MLKSEKSKCALGLDLGGTFIKGVVVSENGAVLAQKQTATPEAREVEDTVANIISVIVDLMERWPGCVGIGLGSPGLVDAERRKIRSSPNFPAWKNVPLKDLISSQIHLPLILENDVNCFALGEHRWGAGKKFDYMLALAVGTGIGGGIIINRKLYRGWSGAGGELGHMSIDLWGPKCDCGGYGCIERYLGNKWLVAAAQEALGNDSIESPEDIGNLAISGDRTALQFIEGRGELLGVACASMIHAFDPQALIIGGGIAQLGDPFFKGIRRAVKSRAYPELSKNIAILPAKLGTLAGAIGAAALGFDAEKLNG